MIFKPWTPKMTEQTKPEESVQAEVENAEEQKNNEASAESSPNKPQEPNGCCGSCS